MSETTDEPGHGHSPAAWAGVIIMTIAVAIGTVFFFLDQPLIVWASVGLLIIGALVGWLMSKAGYGSRGPKYTPKGH